MSAEKVHNPSDYSESPFKIIESDVPEIIYFHAISGIIRGRAIREVPYSGTEPLVTYVESPVTNDPLSQGV